MAAGGIGFCAGAGTGVGVRGGAGNSTGGRVAQADNSSANSHGLARNSITGEDGSHREHASSITRERKPDGKPRTDLVGAGSGSGAGAAAVHRVVDDEKVSGKRWVDGGIDCSPRAVSG